MKSAFDGGWLTTEAANGLATLLLYQNFLFNPLEPSVQYIGQQSHRHFFLSAVSLLDITRPLVANLA